MTKMNRFFAMAMAASMLAGTIGSMSAFAENEDDRTDEYYGWTETDIDVAVDADYIGTQDEKLSGTKSSEIENSIIGKVGHESTPTIYVEVEWDEMKFTYDFGTVVHYDWDLEKLEYVPVYEYENGKGQGWNKESAWIEFTNYSNRDVYTGVSFELNNEPKVYDDVEVTFDREEVKLLSDVGRGRADADVQRINMFVEGAPKDTLREFSEMPALGYLKFYISEYTRYPEPEKPAEPEPTTQSGEHEHHYVYDQFGRLVCTGCNDIKHEYCIDMDEDGICDECGLERDFCEDCHVGGKCICT